jgi:hypothetical protein
MSLVGSALSATSSFSSAPANPSPMVQGVEAHPSARLVMGHHVQVIGDPVGTIKNPTGRQRVIPRSVMSPVDSTAQARWRPGADGFAAWR